MSRKNEFDALAGEEEEADELLLREKPQRRGDGNALMEEEEGMEGQRQRRRNVWQRMFPFLRLAFEIVLCLVVVGLLAWPLTGASDEEKRRTPVLQLPRKMRIFTPDPKYLNDNMFKSKDSTLETLHNWLDLTSVARGYISVPQWQDYDLQQPLTIPLNRTTDGPGYMMTVFHQLHCLSYLVEHLQEGYAGIELTDKVAEHTAHCFDYLRQGLMCNADITLEGKTGHPGWGSEHECVDFGALQDWANENAAQPWRATIPSAANIL